jgi:hypothetical protein
MSSGGCSYRLLLERHNSVICQIDPCPESSIDSLVDIGIDDTCGVWVERTMHF